ncbi:MAG: terminase [Bryobacteraceae bacterium]
MTPKQKAFLKTYATTANITSAARFAKVGRRSHYDWLQDAEYAQAFEDAKAEACELLEREALRRAMTGTLEPVFYQGKKCGTVRRYADTLLIFLMKGAMPNKYRDNVKVEHTGELALITERLAAARRRLKDATP